MNQGGPGSHLDDVASFHELVPRSVLEAYDIVSFDQRGFGRSAPIRCGLAPDQQFTFPWPLPDGEPAVRERAAGIARQCAQHAGASLSFVGTANVARDLDRIRQALGEERITYLGVSYGTYLGIAYDSMFPQRVDQMLLESNVNPAAAWRNTFRESMTEGVEQRFGDFAEFVATRHSEYGLGTTKAEVRRSFLDLVRQLDAEPLSTPAGAVTGAHLRIGLLAPLYTDAAFPLGAQLLTAARDGDATVAGAAGTELQLWYDDDNTASAQMAVFCADGTWPQDPAVYEAQARVDAARYPLTGGAGAAIWPCAFWPSDPIDPPIRATGQGRPNILLINNLRDPATTYDAATALRRQLGERARLVGVDRGGHGAYLGTPNACAQRVGTDFLVHGARPGRDFLCPAEHAELRGALEHLTTVQHVPGALAEIRDDTGTTELSSGVADVRSGRPPVSSDRVRIFSNTKTFVATVVLQLSAEGRLALDAPVERYLPGLIRGNGNDGREISVRQLLSHTSGLPDYDSPVHAPNGGYYRHRYDHHTPEELVRSGISKPRLGVPGSEFHYSTTNYVLAGMIIEEVTGRSYGDEVTERILRPLGLRDTVLPGDHVRIPGRHARGYAHLDGNKQLAGTGRRIDVTQLNPSLLWAGGEMVSTVSDLNTFFAALLAGRLLPAPQLAQMKQTVPANVLPGASYGLGLIRMSLSCGGQYWTHGGSGLGFQTRHGTTLDGRQVGIVITTSPSTTEQSAALLDAVDTALCAATPAR
ncbi:alpha/beta fold hydrolase [Micromonospora sp. NBC_01813]|uniref:alpha/beta fold hydrolase n=1 Tax=Micromonospora sp. NBC_01813 TaxID=2975988 RepID=UPI002DD9E785|nr:alpha/beta fold hydrolase [Micromonospora sp. NBC_01813]WSA11731.1 alpha/beta fold hydrolase [Micromonospora sp. NBC_01813]